LAIAWTDSRSLTPAVADRWVTTLPAIERARFARFRHVGSGHEFLAGRVLVRRWLMSIAGTAADRWQFTEGPHGRPDIAFPETPFQFNLAHSGGVVACILSYRREAGVDVEDLNRRPLDPTLWHRYCAASEVADIEAQPGAKRQHRFLTYWTLKEAYLKARGLGIAVHLADVAFTLGTPFPTVAFHNSLAGTTTDWALGVTPVADHHLISWATPQPPGAPRPTVTLHPVALADLTD
jgi:4'-phosphopantetheinyl transferase